MITMAKFSNKPAIIHYKCLQRIAFYLRYTIDWGIIYWRTTPNEELLDIKFTCLQQEKSFPPFPIIKNNFQLVGFVDAAHANCLRSRRSHTGYYHSIAGGAIVYRCKTQLLVALSSTEAEFYAAVDAAKVIRYLRFILKEIDFAQTTPTPLYEDNKSTIRMINARVPTERSRHIDIRFFAIQDWKYNGDLIMHHIAGIINSSDALTKALGWILQYRHCTRMMGHYGI